MRNFDIPFGKSPEEILERKEERKPRQYAMDIFRKFESHQRIEQVDRIVPPHLRALVREYLTDWTTREKYIRG
jgi:hypothetical protein